MSTAGPQGAQQARAQSQQRRAVEPDASVWVAASAGTGKTKVLIDRVLSLLLQGTQPSRILCLTFTKAAAAEMANRLALRLAQWVADSEADLADELQVLLGRKPDQDLLHQARRLFARVLDTPGGMKIQTIHAFCQALLGRFPLEAGVPPQVQVLDERSAAEMQGAACDLVLAAAGEPGAAGLAAALGEITRHTNEQSFAGLIAELIAERSRFARLLDQRGGSAGLRSAIHKVLGVDPRESVESLRAAACADSAFDFMGLRLASGAMLKGSTRDRERGEHIVAWLDDPATREQDFTRYLGAFFTKGGAGEQFEKLIHKAALAAAPGADQILAGEAERLSRVRAKLRAITVARASAALMELGEAILTAYDRQKALRARLDYDDLILKTRKLLADPSVADWVLFKLDGGLDHVLIDEAQDTNPEQWQVIQSLTAEFFAGEGRRDRPRTVFAVGDAKQSIFSFQRADPAAFEAMREHFAAKARDARQRMELIDLDVSFRSTTAVLEAVDAVFAQADARDGLLHDSAEVHHEAMRGGQAGLVELWPPVSPAEVAEPEAWAPPLAEDSGADGETYQGLAPQQRLAKLIAHKICWWCVAPEGEHDKESWLESKARRLRPGDVLVLVRRRKGFVEELVRELKILNVPVAGVDRMVLTEQLAVMDLVALGRVLLLPEDDLTLASVLKGPLIGLDEEQLFTLAHGRRGDLWDALRRRAGRDPVYASAYKTLSLLRARADFVRPYELYGELLGPGRGREKLLARLGPEADDPIEEFLSLALSYERERVASLEGFLHWLESGQQEVKRDLEQGREAVRVMTVHGAKGLQAPVVFLPDTLQAPGKQPALLWLASGDKDLEPLAIWPLTRAHEGPETAQARAAARRLQDQEYRRLLYVAMTRAEDRLYICGWNAKRAAPEGCWYKLIERALPKVAEERSFDFSAEIRGGWQGSGWRIAHRQVAPPELSDQADQVPPAPVSLPEWGRRPPPDEPPSPRPFAPSRPVDQEPASLSPLAGDRGERFRRGNLIHRLLQSLPNLPPEQREKAARRFLDRPVTALTGDEQEEILAETLAVLENPDFAPLFGPQSRAEVAIAGRIQPATSPGIGGESIPYTISGQVDRLLVTDQAVTILDYKTNRPPPEVETEVPTLYLRQMAAYRSVLKEIYPDRPIRCLLLWTAGPRLMQLSDAALAKPMP